MAASRENFSIISSEHILEGHTVIAAYWTTRSIRVFFESIKGLREIKFRVDVKSYSLTGIEFPFSLAEKNPKNGAIKDKAYFEHLARRSKTLIKTVSSEDAERILSSLTSAGPSRAREHWAEIVAKFETVLAVDQELESSDSSFIP